MNRIPTSLSHRYGDRRPYLSVALVVAWTVLMATGAGVLVTDVTVAHAAEPPGNISYFQEPDPIRRPIQITTGPDGNLWFTEFYGNRIGKITTADVITTYTNPNVYWPKSITVGPDGNLWYVNSGGWYLGRITPDGVMTDFQLGCSGANNIATGSDGNIWFTNYRADSIGRVGTAPVVPAKPVKPSAVDGDASAVISWTVPTDGGSPITGYTVGAVEDATKKCTTTGAATCTVTDLINGTSYTFHVRAPPTSPGRACGRPRRIR